MTRFKVLLITSMAILGVMAVSAAAAQAEEPAWKINGAFLEAGETESVHGVSTTSVTLTEEGGLTLVNEAGNCSATGEIIGGKPGTNTETLTCTGVTVEGFGSVCTVHSAGQAGGTIQTALLHSKLVWLHQTGGAAGVLFTPPAGQPFTTIFIEGINCPFRNEEGLPVTGEEVGEALPVEEEVVTGELVFPSPPILQYWTGDEPNRVSHGVSRLKLGANNATFAGRFDVTLDLGEKFGIF